jgi:hypothetical protein
MRYFAKQLEGAVMTRLGIVRKLSALKTRAFWGRTLQKLSALRTRAFWQRTLHNIKSMNFWIKLVEAFGLPFANLFAALIVIFIIMDIEGEVAAALRVGFVILSATLGGLTLTAAGVFRDSPITIRRGLIEAAKKFIFATALFLIFSVGFAIAENLKVDPYRFGASSFIFWLSAIGIYGGAYTFSFGLIELLGAVMRLRADGGNVPPSASPPSGTQPKDERALPQVVSKNRRSVMTKSTRQVWLVILLAVLALAAIGFLVMAFVLTFDTDNAVRTFLVEQKLLEASISLFGVLSAGFIAAVALIYVNRLTLTYSWRRDQALKDVEKIYEPLYNEVGKLVKGTKHLEYFEGDVDKWESFKTSYLGTKLELMGERLFERLNTLFLDLKLYSAKQRSAVLQVEAIAKKAIEPRLNKNLAPASRNLILDDMPRHLVLEGEMLRRFAMQATWSEPSSLAFNDESAILVTKILAAIQGKGYWQAQQFTSDDMKSILKDIYQVMKGDVQVKEDIDWCAAYSRRAVEVRKELEKHILDPQLP